MAALAAALVAAVPAVAATPRPHASDWSQDGHDATHNGFNPDEYRITAATVKRLALRWTLSTATGAEQQQTPIVAGSQLFVADSAGIGAYDASTGTTDWKFPLPTADEPHPPAIATDGQSVYAYLRTGEIVALEADTGAVRWRRPVPSSAPAGRLLLDRGVAVVGGNDGTTLGVWAFEAATGTPLWQKLGLDPQAPVADGKILLSRPFQGGIQAVDIGTGRVLWESDKDWFGYAADPTGRFFLVESDAELSKVRADDGEVAWQRSGLWGIPAIDHDRVYTGDENEADTIVALDLDTGEPLWRLAAGLMPSVAGGVLWTSHSTPSDGWQLEAVDPVAGVPLDLPAGVHSSGGPDRTVISQGWLYTTDGATLRAFTLTDPPPPAQSPPTSGG